MVLPEDLINIVSYNNEQNKISVSFTLNEMHPVFEGHFPGQPVLPGVLQMALINECLRKVSGKNLRINKTGQLKFLAMIDPNQCKNLQAEIIYQETPEKNFMANARIFNEQAVFFKLNAEYIPV